MSFNVDFFETYGAAIAAVFGGIGVKIVEKVLTKRSDRFSEESRIRRELRSELEAKREEVESLKKETDTWRAKYYEQMEVNLSMNQQFETFRLEVQRQHLKDDDVESKDNT